MKRIFNYYFLIFLISEKTRFFFPGAPIKRIGFSASGFEPLRDGLWMIGLTSTPPLLMLMQRNFSLYSVNLSTTERYVGIIQPWCLPGQPATEPRVLANRSDLGVLKNWVPSRIGPWPGVATAVAGLNTIYSQSSFLWKHKFPRAHYRNAALACTAAKAQCETISLAWPHYDALALWASRQAYLHVHWKKWPRHMQRRSRDLPRIVAITRGVLYRIVLVCIFHLR